MLLTVKPGKSFVNPADGKLVRGNERFHCPVEKIEPHHTRAIHLESGSDMNHDPKDVAAFSNLEKAWEAEETAAADRYAKEYREANDLSLQNQALAAENERLKEELAAAGAGAPATKSAAASTAKGGKKSS